MNENIALSYLKSFYSQEERTELSRLNHIKIDLTKNDCTTQDKEYQALNSLYKELLDSDFLNDYRIEVGPNCTFLIEELFKRYVTDDTFVLVTEQEHPAVKYFLTTKNIHVLLVEDIDKKDVIKRILRKYKKSKCKSFFLMMAGVIPGSAKFLKQEFFVNLKQSLIANHIPNVLILDDCQGIYMANRDYSIFDGILGTAHVLIKSDFEMGILLTKLPQRIGYINKAGLKAFVKGLQIICKHKQAANEFHSIFKELFKDEIDNNTFEIKNDQAKHMLVIQANQVPFNQKYADQMEKANITFSELNSPVGTIRLRYQEAITKDPDIYINEYIPKLKKILRALKRAKEVRENLVFDNSVNINYDFTINKNNVAISEINKKQLKKSFYTKEDNLTNQYEDCLDNQPHFHYIYNKVR